MTFAQAALAALQRFMDGVTPFLNEVVAFFLILFIGFLLGKIIGRLTRKLLTDLKADELTRRLGLKLSLERSVGGLLSFLIYAASVVLALAAVGLLANIVQILLVLFVIILIVSAILALKETAPNLAAGLALRRNRRLKEGAYIRMEGVEGIVQEISLLETAVETRGGDLVQVPNALFQRKEVRIMRRKPAPAEPVPERTEQKKDAPKEEKAGPDGKKE